jgi:integrase/recombinase XerD
MSLPAHHRSLAARTRRTVGARSPSGSAIGQPLTIGNGKANGLDAGVSLRDVQDFAPHADPKTTRRYDRSRHALNCHATYVSAHYLAGGN